METQQQQGTICAYLEKKGFGFISRGTGKTFQKFFFHVKSYKSGMPVVGASVSFNVAPVTEGPCPTAVDVTAVGPAGLEVGGAL